MSLVLLGTAMQAPLVQTYYGTETRIVVAMALEAILIPLYALWLAGVVLACFPPMDNNNDTDGSSSDSPCWTRRLLSLKPLVVQGDASLTIYCPHLVILSFYTMVLAYVTTGDWRFARTMNDFVLRVQASGWHAPIQWVLVLAVSKWYESPLRKLLVRRRISTVTTVNVGSSSGTSKQAVDEEETMGLLSQTQQHGYSTALGK